MSAQLNNLGNITIDTSHNSGYIASDGSSTLAWPDQNIVEFVEFALEIMGIGIKYSDFKNMSQHEKAAVMRDLKIDRALNTRTD